MSKTLKPKQARKQASVEPQEPRNEVETSKEPSKSESAVKGQVIKSSSVRAKREPILTSKQKAFTKTYVQTLNGTKSAQAVYDTRTAKVAQVIASENLSKPMIKQEIQRLMDMQGLGDSFIATKYKELIEQGTSQASMRKVQPKDALRALELVSKIRGHLDKHTTSSKLVVRTNMGSETPNQLKDRLIQLREEEEKYLK